MGEVAAVVSAITAVAGLLLAVFGVPLVGGSSPLGRGAAADGTSTTESVAAPSASASPSVSVSASASASGAANGPDSGSDSGSASDSGSDSGSGAASASASASASSCSPSLPEDWHRVKEAALTACFGRPGGWSEVPASEVQSTWRSPNGEYDLSIKRDRSYGSTPQAASAGQLAWYRDSPESSMADLEVTTHTTRQNGRDALWIEIDYHWVKQSEPRKRLEVFVAGRAGYVYQLLVDTSATAQRLAEQTRLFATARKSLLIDVTAT